MPILGRDAILQADDLKKELVPCPEWGGEVWVRGLTAKERDEFESSILVMRGKTQELNMKQARTKLAVLSICDEQGKRLFGEGDIGVLSAKSSIPLNRIFETAQRLSGLTQEDVDELTKNSESGQPEDSFSG